MSAKTRVPFLCWDNLLKEAREYAEDESMSLSELLRLALKKYLLDQKT
jgi:hypothetical protein